MSRPRWRRSGHRGEGGFGVERARRSTLRLRNRRLCVPPLPLQFFPESLKDSVRTIQFHRTFLATAEKGPLGLFWPLLKKVSSPNGVLTGTAEQVILANIHFGIALGFQCFGLTFWILTFADKSSIKLIKVSIVVSVIWIIMVVDQ